MWCFQLLPRALAAVQVHVALSESAGVPVAAARPPPIPAPVAAAAAPIVVGAVPPSEWDSTLSFYVNGTQVRWTPALPAFTVALCVAQRHTSRSGDGDEPGPDDALGRLPARRSGAEGHEECVGCVRSVTAGAKPGAVVMIAIVDVVVRHCVRVCSRLLRGWMRRMQRRAAVV